jgi:energy-coupling factor transport system ATP-binding protein
MPGLINFDQVTFHYSDEGGSGREVLQRCSLEINQGEMVALVGSNGSGKTTLLRHINGLLLPSSGRVLIDGLDTRRPSDLVKIRQQVGLVFQNPEEQIVATTVEEDVAFGPENLGLSPREISERVKQSLLTVGMAEHALRSPHLLSGGQMQRLALAGVLAMHPKIILFDEATTMLDPAGRRMAMEWMQRLHDKGITIIFITHHMEEAAIASRVVILHNGQVAVDGSPESVFTESARLAPFGLGLPRPARLSERLQPWLGKIEPLPLHPQDWLDHLPHWRGSATVMQTGVVEHPGQDDPARVMIDVRGLEHTYLLDTPLAYPSLRGIDLAAYSGETLGLLGRTGSGKSTLLHHLNGLLRPQRGTIRVGPYALENEDISTRTVTQFVGLVFQRPETQFFEQYVGDEISYAARQMPTRQPLAERVRQAMQWVGLDFDSFKDRVVSTLSGGEKRKVALAATLVINPQVLLLDEPTAGLDPVSHLEVLGRIAALAKQGMTMVLSSHRMNDLAAVAQRLAVFENGKVIDQGLTAEVFWKTDILAAASLEPPLVVRTTMRLIELGWPLPRGIVTPDALETALEKAIGQQRRRDGTV